MDEMQKHISVFSEKNHPVIDISYPNTNTPDWQSGTVILIDKPKGWSSFKVVHELRKCIQFKKIGHAGTLDPMATGLLVLCTGKATKIIETIQSGAKRYEAEITFGASTPSFDAETEIDQSASYEHLDRPLIQSKLDTFFSGEILQKAPAYSALKHKGQPLYKLARAGKEVPVKERYVQIYDHRIESYNLPKLTLYVHCSKGTYIRSLAHDLGIQCKSRAYLSGLIRSEVFPFKCSQAWTIDSFRKRFCNDTVNVH